jgi:hypothetical protein
VCKGEELVGLCRRKVFTQDHGKGRESAKRLVWANKDD